MKIGIGTAFVLALVFHGALLATLAINVSLDKPKRPEERPGQIMHATIVPVPPAKGSPQGKVPQPSANSEQEEQSAAQAKAEAEAKAKAEALAKEVAAQKKAEAERQKAIALKKKAEEEAKAKAEAEAKAKAEAEAKAKAEAEAKRKAEAEAKAKAKAEAEAKRKAEEEARRLIEEEIRKAKEAEEAKAKAAALQAQQAQQANNLEDELLGQVNGSTSGEGLGAGTGSNDSLTYGSKVQQLIEQNWRIDPSMNGKRVVVTVTVDAEGMITNEKCEGDRAVCASAIATLHLIGMLPMPPKGCKDCNTIVITMTPKI